MKSVIQQHLQLMGLPMKDRVTGFVGVVSSICFDVYGCIQAVLAPPMNDKGELPDSRYFDVKRLVANWDRVMPVFEFDKPPGKEAGAAEKPRAS
jgi:hypothetical protein